MAVRAENSAVASFGVFATRTTVTHYKVETASPSAALIPATAFAAPIVVEAGAPAQINMAAFDLRFLAGTLENAGLNAIMTAGVNAVDLKVILMTNSTTIVATSGYSSPTISGFTFTNEADSTSL